MSIETNIADSPPTTRQAIISYTAGEYENHTSAFRFVLRTDGSGYLYDIPYGEALVIEDHRIKLEEFADVLVLTPIRNDADYRNAKHVENEIQANADWELQDLITELFDELNDQLNNPVGDPPPDSDLTLAYGTTQEDLEKCIAVVSYLAKVHGYDDTLRFSSATHESNNEQAIKDYDDADPRLNSIILEILNSFDPRQSTYDYVDENDGRVTAYSAGGYYFEVGADEVEHYFPSARERLDARKWLHDKFVEMGMDTSLIETTFPLAM